MLPTPRVFVTLASRLASSRLPRKALLDVDGVPLIAGLVRRLAAVRPILCVPADDYDAYWAVLTRHVALDSLVMPAVPDSVPEDDVLGRLVFGLDGFLPEPHDWVVRLTADSPLLDPAAIQAAIATARIASFGTGALANCWPPDQSPDCGQDIELVRWWALVEAERATRDGDPRDREHPTRYLVAHRGGPWFHWQPLLVPDEYGAKTLSGALREVLGVSIDRPPPLAWCVDTPEDWARLAPLVRWAYAVGPEVATFEALREKERRDA